MLAFQIILAGLSGIVVLQTALSFVRSRAWWVRIFDFPRPQITLCSAGLLVLFGATAIGPERVLSWQRVYVGLLAGAVFAQLWQIIPYTRLWRIRVPPAPPRVATEQRLRLLVSNVCMKNRQAQRWIDLVREEKPHIAIAVEVDAWWRDQLRALHKDWPHHVCEAQDNTYGMAIYSRLPLGPTRVEHLVDPEVPSLFTAVELPGGRTVHCAVLHPRPPRPDIQQDSSLRDAELVRAGRIVRELRGPVIVAGDLNDVAWSHTTHLFQRIASLLDPRVGRGLFATFPVRHRFMRFPLDHVFHSRDFDLVELRRLPDIGSDHFPMLIELALRETAQDRPEPPECDADDEEQATDAVEDAREERASESPAERAAREAADR